MIFINKNNYWTINPKSLMNKLFLITMRWTICISLLMSVLSCSDDDADTTTPESEKYLRAEIDRAGSGDLATLQISSIVKINFTSNFTDSLTIIPAGNDPRYHQKDKSDYLMYERRKQGGIVGGGATYKYNVELINGKGAAYIRIYKPGSFRLAFKIKENETIISDTIMFSAVKIDTWTKYTKIRDGSSGTIGIGSKPSKHQREFFYSIDNGDQPFDKYLEMEGYDNYTSMYMGREDAGHFEVGTPSTFYPVSMWEGKKDPSFEPYSNIEITLKGNKGSVTYKNILIQNNY